MIAKKQYAMVLCGGGGKGAFQIGALQALHEQGFLNNVGAISGTSVGALNATLLALGDLQNACQIWKNITPQTLLSFASDGEDGVCSRDGLSKIIESLDLSAVSSLDVPFYVGTTDENLTTVYTKLNGKSVDEIREYLLASSAIPGVYGGRTISGRKMMDGGLSGMGNTPIRPLYDEGFRDFIVIALDRGFSLYDLRDLIFKDRQIESMSDARFFVIQPLDDVGGFFDGMLNFNPEKIASLMEQGFVETKKILEMDLDYIYKRNPQKAFELILQKNFHSPEDFESFVKFAKNFDPSTNLPASVHEGRSKFFRLLEASMEVMGEELGAPLTRDLCFMFGWKLQSLGINSNAGHYRMLSPAGMVKLNFSSSQQLFSTLEQFVGRKN